ncbi:MULTISPECIES: MetS family NSS transporter small subunit [Shewanella]|uniref:MetS family NSS transporter small subunit n=1 Tax=Shewanella marisflavi TaxID=260364 RepID=A0ABX5WIZ4_9GAMM|nr:MULTISPECIES: MetS family NSS transporter small subunit [Shewanella]MCL1043130.1 MetS family NSS transporter small subunit [Shewanella marisflavi]QDF74518.1 MetS family NSS transporter small subunit [Shewanella marisflavi]
MSQSAFIMMLFALALTWGGAALCIAIAIKRKQKEEADD